MAVSEKKHQNNLPLADGVEKDPNFIPHDYILNFKYSSFKPERRGSARRQIENLKKKMKIHAHLKEYCLEQINKLIRFEQGELYED